jgi:hypothetical protein
MSRGGLRRFWLRFWDALPIDGCGFLRPDDPDARRLIAYATRRRIPGPVRPFILVAGRLLWCVKAARRVRRARRLFGFGSEASRQQFADACLRGVQPKDSAIWRQALGAPRRPLSCDAYVRIQSSVGDPGQRRLLSDKLATSVLLERLGVAVPELLAVIRQGTPHPALPSGGADMFVKPASGSRSRDAFRVDGRVRDEALTARLRQAAASDALLVQRCLQSASGLADLATDGVPPVLRIITAREPGGDAFLHSALFSIRVPGESAAHPFRGHIRVPVALAEGVLLPGYWFGEPESRFHASPWHGAPIAERALPGFDEAAVCAVRAAVGFDRLAVIAWDVILSDRGPVILEGNSHCSWIFMTLARQGAPGAVPILPLLGRWAAAEE